MAAEMSSDQANDLAGLRALAEEGRNRPLLGGRHFILWGCAIAAASVLHMAIGEGWLPWPPMALAAVWFGIMTGAAIIGRTVLGKQDAAPTVGNRVEREVWRASGAVLGTLAVAIFAFAYIIASQNGSAQGYMFFAMMPPVTFGVYAIALAASAAAARAEYLKPYAALSVAFLFLTMMLVGSVWQFAAMALGAICVSVVPGFALIAREKTNV